MLSRNSRLRAGHAFGAKNVAPSSPAWYASLGRPKGPTLNRSPTIRRAADGSGSESSVSSETRSFENIAAMCSGLISYPRLSFMSPTANERFSAKGASKNVSADFATFSKASRGTP